jgi:hypothetical protein
MAKVNPNFTKETFGWKAVMNGCPDYGDDPESRFADIIDTLANIMHYAESHGLDVDEAYRIAGNHFDEEIGETNVSNAP